MTRLPDWQARLTDYLRSVARQGFAYGRHDCCTFTAGCVAAMTGVDPMRGFRGYRTLAAGLRRADARGFPDHIAVVATLFAECPPAYAQAGDIAVVEGETLHSLGIVQGARIYVIGPHGIGTVPLDAARRAFRV
jgi:hypothetical protein